MWPVGGRFCEEGRVANGGGFAMEKKFFRKGAGAHAGIRCDAHVHTAFSTDSDASIKDMLEAALKKGMDAVCITDHLDLDFPYYEDLGDGAFTFNVEEYVRTLDGLRREYADRLEVRTGIELGLQPHLAETFRGLLRERPFDFVIGSVHLVKGKDPYYREAFGEIDDKELYRAAFEATLENVKATDAFDVLGHLDYVVRYGKGQAREYSYLEYADILDEILRTVIGKGKGIEINTAGLRYGLRFCNPHSDILLRFRELGGEIVTVGSDAHKPGDVAWEFGRAAEILSGCGFRHYAEFEAGKPIFKKLG
jgi:histidinol-phosphatase (PHP family)